ncbi:hypothetical protein HMPREF0201_01642 [Cedecea davisae DSM 4568]|uniref:Uncharacterized protein n=1 Tax=Cedecea davisae DSM 4568 TaxID=566551 RepID=S3J0F7_9ENTR|nr:hypothetical protein HMPREF0201_01642 [Cedecea davisae DSM 4568]
MRQLVQDKLRGNAKENAGCCSIVYVLLGLWRRISGYLLNY